MLDTLTVNGVPPAMGVALDGLTSQVDGFPDPQLNETVLLYPFMAVRVPLNVADVFTEALSEGFAIVKL